MGSGEKRHMNFHLHFPHLLHNNNTNTNTNNNNNNNNSNNGGPGKMKGVPKGCMVVMVGHEGEEKLQRFVIPIVYINHPLFMQLLKEAEEEYGFDHKGPITIPCHVEQFRNVQGMIDQERHHHHHHHHHDLHHHHDNHHHHFLCF